MDRTRLARAVLSRLDPETAHELTLWALRHGLGPARAGPDDPVLAVRLWGRDISGSMPVTIAYCSLEHSQVKYSLAISPREA